MRKYRIVFLVLLCGLMFQNSLVKGQDNSKITDIARDLDIYFNAIKTLYTSYVDSINSKEILKAAFGGISKDLDPYTEYISDEDLADFSLMTTGKYGGVGCTIMKIGDYVEFRNPSKGFPADKMGITLGDKILEIDGVSMKGLEVSKVSEKLKGEVGSKFKLQIEKLRTKEIKEFTIKREEISIPAVPYYGMPKEDMGYINLSSFTDKCGEDVKKALVDLLSKGAKGMVLDLRGNSGGILQEAVKIVGLFVKKGTEVVHVNGKAMKESHITEEKPVSLDIPLAVLIDAGSASASEIVAGALQDLDRAIIIGQKSFGKGLVQSTMPLNNSTYLKLTTGRYYIPSGRCIQELEYNYIKKDSLVEDSLNKKVFKTLSGRDVFEGGGIAPDIKIVPEYISKFAMLLYAEGLIDKFVNEFFKKNESVAPVEEFVITDETYNAFKSFVDTNEFKYYSSTLDVIEKLKTESKKEKYYEKIKTLVDSMEVLLKEDISTDFILYEKDIKNLLAQTILLAYYYQSEEFPFSLRDDSELDKAIEVLKSDYRTYLSPKE